jgi:hypothetical protein
MKTICLLLTLTLGLVLAAFGAAYSYPSSKPAGKLLHVVAFKFKAGATPEQIRQVEEAFRGLKKKIKEIQSLDWGTNVSPEKHDKGFTHGWVLAFKSEKDRDTYLKHPDHQAFGALVGPVLADVFVIDFWAQR